MPTMRGTSDRKGEMQRKDLDTLTVLEAVKAHGMDAIDHLLHTYPEKVILAAYRRDWRYLDYGVSERRVWLEPAGERYLKEHSTQR